MNRLFKNSKATIQLDTLKSSFKKRKGEKKNELGETEFKMRKSPEMVNPTRNKSKIQS